jgi:hypothetical protein
MKGITIYRLWLGDYLLEEIRSNEYIFDNEQQMLDYIEYDLKPNWEEFNHYRNLDFLISKHTK